MDIVSCGVRADYKGAENRSPPSRLQRMNPHVLQRPRGAFLNDFVPASCSVAVLSAAILIVTLRAGVLAVLIYAGLALGMVLAVRRSMVALGTFAIAVALGNLASAVWIVTQSTSSLSPSEFVIGDSDSALYNSCASSIADTIPWREQLKFWDDTYLLIVEGVVGYVFKDRAFVRLLGLFYTAVGPSNAPVLLALINPLLCGFAISIVTKHVRGAVLHPMAVVAFTFAFVANLHVLQVVVSCRKDVLVAVGVLLSVHYFAKRQLVAAVMCSAWVCVARSGFIALYLTAVILFLAKQKWRITEARFLLLGAAALVLAPQFMPYLIPLDLHAGQIDAETAELYRTPMGASSILVNIWTLNAVYVLFSPFPIASLSAYGTQEAYFGMLAFISNLALLLVWVGVVKHARGDLMVKANAALVLAGYLAVMWNMQKGLSLGLIGVIEPRYKLSIWLLQLCAVVYVYCLSGAPNRRWVPQARNV